MYVCMAITSTVAREGIYLPGKVTNPARGQLNRENEYFPVPVTVNVHVRELATLYRVLVANPDQPPRGSCVHCCHIALSTAKHREKGTMCLLSSCAQAAISCTRY